MDKTVGEDISGVTSRSEVEATGVEGDEGVTSLSPEEFAGEYERGGGRKRGLEGGGESEGEAEREDVGEEEGEGEGERESDGDNRETGAEEVDPEVDAPEEKVVNCDATEPASPAATPRITRTWTCL